jgi:hypothetical protein
MSIRTERATRSNTTRSSSPALVRRQQGDGARHLPEIADGLYFGHVGNQGDAVRWGTALGARAKDMTAYQGTARWPRRTAS